MKWRMSREDMYMFVAMAAFAAMFVFGFRLI